MSAGHTKEPWHVNETQRSLIIVGGSLQDIARMRVLGTGKQRGNAERIVACVNAMAGLSLEEIEELGTMLQDIKKKPSPPPVKLDNPVFRIGAKIALKYAKVELAEKEAELERDDPQACTQIEWIAEPLVSLRRSINELEDGLR